MIDKVFDEDLEIEKHLYNYKSYILTIKRFAFAIILIGFSSAASAEISSKNGIATDSVTGLIWQDDKISASNKKDWSGAKQYCEKLAFNGFDDWRLPNIYELATLIDNTKKKEPYITSGIKYFNLNSDFWSSDFWSSTASQENGEAYYVRFGYGIAFPNLIELSSGVRCVRGKFLGYNDLVILESKSLIKASKKTINSISPHGESKRIEEANTRRSEWAASTKVKLATYEKQYKQQSCSSHYVGKLVKYKGGALNLEWKAIILGIGDGVMTIKNTTTNSIQEVRCDAVD